MSTKKQLVGHFQSYHGGIEIKAQGKSSTLNGLPIVPWWNWNLGWHLRNAWTSSSNRTMVELKFVDGNLFFFSAKSSNRTMVELKCGIFWVYLCSFHGFQSYHGGIEMIIEHRNVDYQISSNRTMVELKFKLFAFNPEELISFQSYHGGIEIRGGNGISVWRYSSNRTMVELKWHTYINAFNDLVDFQSYHGGIEINLGYEPTYVVLSSNRTMVELKYFDVGLLFSTV